MIKKIKDAIDQNDLNDLPIQDVEKPASIFCYYNFGTDLKMVDEEYTPQEGEILSGEEIIFRNKDIISSYFPDYPAADKYCYFDNGLAMKMVYDDYKPTKAEKVFDEQKTVEELIDIFPKFPKPGKFLYFNDGLGMRTVDSDYKARSGEVLFDTPPSEDELKEAFTKYADKSSEVANRLKIAELESEITPIRLMQAILGNDKGWLQKLSNEIDKLS